MRVTIGATLHSVVRGKLPCHPYGSDNCETAQNIGMDCCAECCFEEVAKRQEDRASNTSRQQKGNTGFAVGCSIDVIDDGEGVDGIVLYDAAKRARLVVENIDGKLNIHVWENADEDSPTTTITLDGKE